MYQKSQIQKITQQNFKQTYDFQEMLDAGTYGIVSKYHDKINNRPVAIKLLKDTQGLPSFLNEEQIMNKVKHQNILECLGLFYNTTKSYYVLITHFCQKKNLKQNLPQIVNLDQQTKIWLCLQIARGINGLHELNIMHRDIKPANILVQNDWKIKLCDFGFGKQDLSLNKSVKVGTPLYRDPNIQFGKYTKKCDIYSVGLVFDTIFRGQCCLKDITGKHIAQQLIHFKQNKKKIIGKLKCSQQMKQIILKCLQNNQNNRYSSLELLKKLQEIWKRLNPYKQNEMIEEIPNNSYQTSLFHSFIQNNNSQEILNQSSFLVMPESTPKFRYKTEAQPENSKDQTILGFSLSEIKPISKNPYKNSQSPSKSKSKTQKKNSLKDLQLSPKKNTSLSQKQNTNFFIQLLKLSQKTYANSQKCQNIQFVYQYFINRQKKIRQLQKLVKSLITIQKNDQKVLIFMGLFGYLRFLIIHENYLKTKNSKTVASIQGIKIDKISQNTIFQCLKLIKSQIQIISESIKPLMKAIHEDKKFYKQKLTKNILNMISVGIEKKFLPIQSQFTTIQIKEEFINFVMHERYKIQNIKQNQIREKIKNIGDIF